RRALVARIEAVEVLGPRLQALGLRVNGEVALGVGLDLLRVDDLLEVLVGGDLEIDLRRLAQTAQTGPERDRLWRGEPGRHAVHELRGLRRLVAARPRDRGVVDRRRKRKRPGATGYQQLAAAETALGRALLLHPAAILYPRRARHR